MKKTAILAGIAASILLGQPVLALPETHEEVLDSAELLLELSQSPETRIPAALIQQSAAIAVVTNVKEGGFIFGGRRGDGIMVSRQSDGTWSNPAFINLTGGSVGLQAGFQSSDLVLLFPSQDALNQVLSGDFELGGSVSGTAGPVGKSAEESLEGFDDDNIYVYSRSEGLFGGVSLEGSELNFDKDDNQEFYNRAVSARDIFQSTSLEAPVVVDSLKSVLNKVE